MEIALLRIACGLKFWMLQVAPSVRLAREALEAAEHGHASEDGPSAEPLSAALCQLLPPLVYQGDSLS